MDSFVLFPACDVNGATGHGGAERPPEESMSRIEQEARALLLQRRRVLRRGPTHEKAPARDDITSSWTDWEAAPEPLSEGVRRELAEIDAALARMAEGRYGTCVSCGGPMGLQRI